MKFDQLVMLCESRDSTLVPLNGTYKFINPGSIGERYVNDTNHTQAYVDSDSYLHRVDGPALLRIYHDGSTVKYWRKHGKLHRLDGPAVVAYNEKGVLEEEIYFINGIRYTKKEFDEYTKGLENNEDKDLLSDLGQTFG